MQMEERKVFPAVIERLWQEYIASDRKDDFFRNKLLENYLPLVKYIAERLYARLPEEIEIDDLMSAGIFGLMDALQGFDPGRGFKFETYCSPRIRGAILDELRDMDWVPRLVRSRASKLKKATTALQSKLGREPTRKELAKHMKLSMREFRLLERGANAVGIVSINQKLFESDSGKKIPYADCMTDKQAEDPQRVIDRMALREMVIKGLSRAERLIIILYYFEEMTMREIGEALDLSESRVSQIHGAILSRLKSGLKHRRSEFIK